MVFTKKQFEEFKEAAKPLVKFLNDNCHPHVIAIVSVDRAEILASSGMVGIEEYIKD